MTEAEFADLIDARFPYRDWSRARALIDQSFAISSNAAFIALEEICRPPFADQRVPQTTLKELFAYWREKSSHPLSERVGASARALIEGQSIPPGHVQRAMDEIASWPGQYAALNIVCFSADPDDEAADARQKHIRADWDRA